jgi:hypothetical protein
VAGCLLGACGGSHSGRTEHVGRLPAAGGVVYSVAFDSPIGLGSYQEGRLRGVPTKSDAGLTQTDHRAVTATSSDGRLIVIDDFHPEGGGGVFVRWRGTKGLVGTRRIRQSVFGPIAVCGSRAVAYADNDRLMLWSVGRAETRKLATPLPPRHVTCASDAKHIAALGTDGALMLGTTRAGLRAIGPLRFSAVEWSPDRSSLAACTLPGDEPAALVLVARDGSIQRRMADARDRCEIAWSPDGRRIAFTDASGRLRVACACTEATVSVASDASSPVWSPDGSAIAYSRGPFGLYAVEFPTGQSVLIADDVFSETVAWIDERAARRVRTLADPYPCC